MNFQILVFLFLSGFFLIKQENPDELLWQSDKKLTWENFKGRPDTNSKPAAVTDCYIRMKYYSKKDTLFANIRAVLLQSECWVKPKSKTPYLLDHEQIHFDIAEVYARRLRQSIFVLKTKKADATKTITIIDKWNDEHLADYQKVYDRETNHSRNKTKQLEWKKRISQELKDLNEFKNTEIRILLK